MKLIKNKKKIYLNINIIYFINKNKINENNKLNYF
jgi:hypothetical protein